MVQRRDESHRVSKNVENGLPGCPGRRLPADAPAGTLFANSFIPQARWPGTLRAYSPGMDWPKQRIETLTDFQPPFCPRFDCPAHHVEDPQAFRYQRFGTFQRKCDGRVVPRFRCVTCGRTFSLQTFATSYWLKRPDLQVPIAAQSVAGSALRQIARTLRCSHSTVHAQVNRLGRHCLLLQAFSHHHITIREPLDYDDFETFAFSQLLPYGMATPVGTVSRWVYALGYAPHRRGGKLTPAQKKSQDRLDQLWGKPPRGAYLHSAREMMEWLLSRVPEGETLVIFCDGHTSYGRAWKPWIEAGRVKVVVFPNPKRGPKGSPRSPEAWLRDRAMFASDQFHGFVRHSRSNHKRETIAHGRRANDQLGRDLVMAVFVNLIKKSTERRPCQTTPGMLLGLTTEPWTWDQVLAKRLFPSKVKLPELWEKIYKREIVTPGLKVNRRKTNLYVC